MLTDDYGEDEIQALIALDEIALPFNNPNDAPHVRDPKNITEAQTYFRRFALDMTPAFQTLKTKGLVRETNGELTLTQAGKKIADELRILRPPIYYWYRDFYAAVETSRAFDEYSRCVFGANFGQHGITSEQYLSKFSGAELTSELTRTKRSKAVGKSWKNNAFQGRKGIPLSTESKELLSQKMMGHPVSEETRRKIGETGLGRVPWNFQHTKHDEPRLMQMSHKIAAWNKSTDTPARRKRISDTLKKKYADGMPLPNAKSGFREDLGMYFRSSWEANYARSLKLDGKEILYETDHISLYENGELDSVYTPDFKTGENHYVEVKGHAESKDLWSCNCKRCERDKRKMEMTRQQYPHLTIEILGKKEYGELREEFEFTIPNWERKALQGKARSSIE